MSKRRDTQRQVFSLALPGPGRDLVIDRGAEWTGRVIDPGDAVLTVRVFGPHPTLGGARALAYKVHIGPNEQRKEDIQWPAGATISGRVLTADGNPVARAEVIAVSSDRAKSSAEGDVEATPADDEGRFAFHHLAPGKWTLVGDRRSGNQVQLVVEAGAADVRIVVPARQP